MQSIAWLGISPEELEVRVAGAVWARWARLEPVLGSFSTLTQLHILRGSDNDPPLGALVRLAAVDGHDDQLAAVALAHQLERGARSLMHGLRDLTPDIDAVVMSALWVRIRTFPWRRRTRAYAANLLRDTRADVLEQLTLRRTSLAFSCLPVDPQSPLWDAADPLAATDPAPGSSDARSADDFSIELDEVLSWALSSRVLLVDEVGLLLELIAASNELSAQMSPWMSRGVSSQIAVELVAARRGVCGKTIRRHRDRILASLRAASNRYLAEAA